MHYYGQSSVVQEQGRLNFRSPHARADTNAVSSELNVCDQSDHYNIVTLVQHLRTVRKEGFFDRMSLTQIP